MSVLSSRRVVIAGGSGFIGVSLARHLASLETTVVLLSRHAPPIPGPWRHIAWDARSLGEWRDELEGASGLVNLTGRSVDCVKTPDHQDEILRSRVEATCVLGEALRSVSNPPPVWVQMSTAHIYGDPPEVICHEKSALGYGLAPDVGRAWERAFLDKVLESQRRVILRTSFVLGKDRGVGAGALTKLSRLARLGLAGTIGNGTQGMSWIHEADMNRLIERALFDTAMQGVYIASAPHPLAQRDFMRELRRAVGMPIGLPTPAWMARCGARWLFRTDSDLAIYGRYVVSQRLADEGFVFDFPHLREALQDILACDRNTATSAQSQSGVSRSAGSLSKMTRA